MRKIIFYFDPGVTRIFDKKAAENGEEKVVLTSPNNFVSRAEIVARVIDIDSQEQIPSRIDPGYSYYNVVDYFPLKIDEGIYFDEAIQAYKAVAYGFVVCIQGKLKLLSARSIARDKIKAYYAIHPTKFSRIPTGAELQEYLHDQKILAGIGAKRIDEQLEKIDPTHKGVTRILVAQGKAPVAGHEEYFKPILEVKKKAGEIRSDGRIDFREVGSVIQVFKGQEILERFPEIKPVDGMDIYGDPIPAQMELTEGYRRGENIVQSGQDENIFLSAIDGVLKIAQRKVSVLETVIINGDVDYNTGNIDFKGSVEVTGSVLPGFRIKASGDVLIKNSIEDAIIESDGDVTIGAGIVGKESVKVICSGTLRSKYMLNATAEVGGDIIVDDSIINSNVFSNRMIEVTAKTGKIIGGNITALYSITVKVAGAPNETPTVLNVGRNLYIERELENIRREINLRREDVQETIRKLRVSFGEGVFEDPKKYISILPEVKRKACLELLQELNNGNRDLKELTEKSTQIAQKLKLDQEPKIVAFDRIYPGTVLNIKKRVRKIEREYENVKFFEDPDLKDIRFTSAS